MDPAAELHDHEIGRLQSLLDSLPPPLQPLDVCALDGFLCGVLMQPQAVAPQRWLRCITDIDARPLPALFDASALHELVLRRHAALKRAIDARQWFDPWVFELDEQASVDEVVLPWIAGFAAAMERFPQLMQIDDARLLEPLALLYRHIDPDDLEDADQLLALIETLEPADDTAEAVQDIVRSLMLMADVVHPLPARPVTPKARQRRR